MDTPTLASSGTVVARAAPGHGEVLAALPQGAALQGGAHCLLAETWRLGLGRPYK